MKHKKKLITVYFFLFIIFEGKCNEFFLEQLWSKAQSYSTDIASAQFLLDERNVQHAYRWTSYTPSLTISSNASFTDSLNEIKEKPSQINTSLSFLQNLPGVLSLGIDISYNQLRTFYDPLQQADFENLAYNHNAAMSISVLQSLLPFWGQGCLKDPIFSQYENSLKQAQIQKDIVKNQILQTVSLYYIRMRMLFRTAQTYRALIDNSKNKIIDYEQLFLKGQIQKEKIWEEEEITQSYIKEQLAILNDYNEYMRKLLVLSGGTISKKSIEENLFSPLPISILASENYEYEKRVLELEKNNINLQKLVINQQHAPYIKFNATVSCNPEVNKIEMTLDKIWQSEKKWDWSYGVSFDLSSLFSHVKQKEIKLLEISLANTNTTICELNEEQKTQKQFYEEYINLLENSIGTSFEILENLKRKKEDYEFLYSTGGCSFNDYEMSMLQHYLKDVQYKNLEDELCYYKQLLLIL